MKTLFAIFLACLITTSSYSETPKLIRVDFPEKKNYRTKAWKVEVNNLIGRYFNEYIFILQMDGCYHLYMLDTYIDNTGMHHQGWVIVDPNGYHGTTSVCMPVSQFENFC